MIPGERLDSWRYTHLEETVWWVGGCMRDLSMSWLIAGYGRDVGGVVLGMHACARWCDSNVDGCMA